MVGKKRIFLIAFALLVSTSSNATLFNPNLSVLTSYTGTKNYQKIESGMFNTQNRKINFGFEVTNTFYLPTNLFLRLGVRYNQFKVTINGENQISTFFDKPYPLVWKRGYDCLTVPVQIGKEFAFHNGNKLSVFVGGSFGVLMNSYAKDEVSSNFPKNINAYDDVVGLIVDNDDQKSSFYASLDFGVHYQPLKSFPRFFVGLFCSMQMNKSNADSYNGIVTNVSKNVPYPYNIQNQNKFVNSTFALIYSFGRPEKPKTRKLP